MKVNPGKCHILLSTKFPIDVHLEGECIMSSSCENLPGITIDADLKFDIFLTYAIKLAKKINTLCRVTGYMSLEKHRIVLKTFFESQSNYCPLISMLHSRTLHNKINCIHEETLRLFTLIMNHRLIPFLKRMDHLLQSIIETFKV